MFTPLAKKTLIKLRLTTAASAADGSIKKKILGSRSYKSRTSGLGNHNSRIYGSGLNTLIFPNEEMENTIKIVKSLEASNTWIKNCSEWIKMKQKNKTADFLLSFWVLYMLLY